MAKVIGNLGGVQFEGTYNECADWIWNVEQEQKDMYPEADYCDLEFYWIEEG